MSKEQLMNEVSNFEPTQLHIPNDITPSEYNTNQIKDAVKLYTNDILHFNSPEETIKYLQDLEVFIFQLIKRIILCNQQK